MLLIRELARVVLQAVGYSLATRRVLLLLVLLSTLVLAALSAAIVKAAPVAVYPFL